MDSAFACLRFENHILFFFFGSSRIIWPSQPWTVHPCTVHESYKFHFSITFSLKIGSTALFTHLKIILLFHAHLASAFACLHFENHVLFFFFFFLFQPHYLTKSTMNSARMHYSWIPQIPLFSHFFIKNWSHGTIHIFKNYFAIVFSVSVFNFSKNKFNPNEPFLFAFLCLLPNPHESHFQTFNFKF